VDKNVDKTFADENVDKLADKSVDKKRAKTRTEMPRWKEQYTHQHALLGVTDTPRLSISTVR
jgi:hypothetical protein